MITFTLFTWNFQIDLETIPIGLAGMCTQAKSLKIDSKPIWPKPTFEQNWLESVPCESSDWGLWYCNSICYKIYGRSSRGYIYTNKVEVCDKVFKSALNHYILLVPCICIILYSKMRILILVIWLANVII